MEVTNKRKRLYAREHSMYINGKRVKVNKRPRPDTCELCGFGKPRLDDNYPEKGLWLCGICHYLASMIEKGLHDKYLRLRQEVNGSTTDV